MLNKIKALADEAIALQNKNRMDDVLREISALCEKKEESPITLVDYGASHLILRSELDEKIDAGDPVVLTGTGKVKRAKGAKDAE